MHGETIKIKCVTVFLDVFLTTEVKIACSSLVVVLNTVAWFILVSFKNGMPNNTVYQLADCYHTLNMYYKGHNRITCKDVHVYSVKHSGQF